MVRSTRSLIKWIALFLLGAALAMAGMGRPFSRAEGRPTAPVEKGPIVESVYGIGTVAANRRFDLRPGVIATVESAFVKEGDFARRGQDLVQVDRVVFKAPFDGTITSFPYKTGENVFVQTPVLTLEDQRDRYVTVSLEQRAAIRVRKGQEAKLSFENLREATFEGTVESVYSHDGNFLVRIEAKGLPEEILPGMTADVAIAISEKPAALLVPVSAIHNGRVSVRRGQGVVQVPIKTGLVDGAVAEVVSGDLKPSERIELPVKGKP